MVDISWLKQCVKQYDIDHAEPKQDHDKNRKRLSWLVNKHGIEVVAVATGLAESSVRVHCNNSQSGMISAYRLKRAEAILAKV
jgi:hypothetical protein